MTERHYSQHFLRLLGLAACACLLFVIGIAGFGSPVRAACATLPAQSQAAITITADETTSYRLWLRQIRPAASANDIFVAVDDQCPVAITHGDTKDSLAWVGSNNQSLPLIFNLAAGQHTVKIAGDQTNVAIDKLLVTKNLTCQPEALGTNCNEVAPQDSQPEVQPPKDQSPQTSPGSNLWWIVGAAAAAMLLVTLAIVGWKYHRFIKRIILPTVPVAAGLPPPKVAHHAFSLATARRFLGHHRIFVAAMALVIAALLVLLGWSIANAQDSQGNYEAEAGTLSGGAHILENAAASGGKLVVMGDTPGAPPPGGPATTPPPSTNPPSGGPTGGGGNNGGGGGGSTPPEVCPPFPAFPDENCTGWQHTGVTLHECETDNGYIWDSNLTFDSCYFPQSLTIFGSNITITRSQIHGTVTPHWSHTYDFGNLKLEDVEIEETGNPAPSSAAIAGHNFTCLRCNVHHTGSGMHAGDNAIIRDSYTHDFIYTDGAHGAGIGIGQGHGSNSQIIHNNIQCNRLEGQPQICSSALSIYDEYNDQGETVDNILVQNNLFNTVGAYCTYAGGPTGTNIRYIDNYFGKKYHSTCAGYGPATAYAPNGGVWTGNVWADGSGPVNHP